MESNHFLVAIIIFVLTYGAIVSEKINRTSISIFGALLMVSFGVLSQKDAVGFIDFNTIGLLIGTMILVNIMKRSGIFEYVAIKSAKAAKGDPWKILVLFSIITAVFSALLNNVTTILLIAPITLVITDTLEVNPIPFLLPQILFSNIGGTSTLIGDPPNVMVGSAVGIGFMDFIVNLLPVVIVIFIVTLFLFKIIYKSTFTKFKDSTDIIMAMDENLAIKDMKLVKSSVAVTLFTILGFVLHDYIGLESATVALLGGAVLLLISKSDPEEIFLDIEWTSIFFFMSLFILVGSMEEIGVIDLLAKKLMVLTGGDMFITAIVILWSSAILSSFLDNIPFVATMIPLIKSFGALTTVSVMPLWWALILGACLGGNGTLVGSSANLIVSGILKKHGNDLKFVEYMKVGFPLMIVSVGISSVYLWAFYL
ncbi:MAG: ArsB/NhaD family transporter [Firmicutes bacterium]|jgi:Na+/H+ antiporter NhaD/arsenite permease-like protein|nr:ArsB/NhaD family transporter [Bacillota bacterium]